MNYMEFNKALMKMVLGKNQEKMIVKCSDGLFALHDRETGEMVDWVKTNHATVEDKNRLLDQLEFMTTEDKRLCNLISEQIKIINDKEQRINDLEKIVKQQKKLIGVLYEASGIDD